MISMVLIKWHIYCKGMDLSVIIRRIPYNIFLWDINTYVTFYVGLLH